MYLSDQLRQGYQKSTVSQFLRRRIFERMKVQKHEGKRKGEETVKEVISGHIWSCIVSWGNSIKNILKFSQIWWKSAGFTQWLWDHSVTVYSGACPCSFSMDLKLVGDRTLKRNECWIFDIKANERYSKIFQTKTQVNVIILLKL